MNNYRHAMVMVENLDDGAALLNCVAPLALDPQSPTEITLSHFSEDYRAMNYISDSMMDDAVAEDVIKAKAMLSHLVKISPFPIKTLQLVTLRQFDDVEKCIADLKIDLVIVGHRNRLFGTFTSRAFDLINHLNTDILIRHIPDKGEH
ncbi:universal stress protein [Pluralibacter gergoviae]|uniref:Universal stress protein n=1 Tax=Pluralibacter gergoviae TaxID=61647 RepID=A0AAW8HJ15_PLUGE|nr:universal stress protein [Pluralibacter gergoviae]AVR02146.1 universal stress protein [Pluralibacter gergoviae]MDQ2308641.1 universal stress protein [Pluralibacter gergoviae]